MSLLKMASPRQTLRLIPVCTILICASLAGSGNTEETNSTVRHSSYIPTPPTNMEREAIDKPHLKKHSTKQLEQRVFNLVNQDRAKSNVPPLKLSPSLSKLAKELADDLLKHDSLAHVDSEGLNTKQRAIKNGIICPVFENVGTQSGPDSSIQMIEELQQSFMSEPDGLPNHRYILLRPDHIWIGIGVAQSRDHVVLVQTFTHDNPDLDSR